MIKLHPVSERLDAPLEFEYLLIGAYSKLATRGFGVSPNTLTFSMTLALLTISHSAPCSSVTSCGVGPFKCLRAPRSDTSGCRRLNGFRATSRHFAWGNRSQAKLFDITSQLGGAIPQAETPTAGWTASRDRIKGQVISWTPGRGGTSRGVMCLAG